MADPGQGGNNPPGEGDPQDQSNKDWTRGIYADAQELAQQFMAPSLHSQTQQNQVYPNHHAQQYPCYTATQPGYDQPASGHEGYGSNQTAFGYGGNTYQQSSAPATMGSGYGHPSNPQYGQQGYQQTSHNVHRQTPSRPPASRTYHHLRMTQSVPTRSGPYTTGSVMPGTDTAPRINWEDDPDFDGANMVEEEEEGEETYSQAFNLVSPYGYSADVDTRTLPARTDVPVLQELPAITVTGLEEIPATKAQSLKAQVQSIEKTAEKNAKSAAAKANMKAAVDRHRTKRSWEEYYTKEKHRLMGSINEEYKKEYDRVKNARDTLLAGLKQHDPNKCKCDDIHQYLWFTGQNRTIRREEAYQRGWLTKEELDSLACRSRTHSRESSAAGSRPSTGGGQAQAQAQGTKKDDQSKSDKKKTGGRGGGGSSNKRGKHS